MKIDQYVNSSVLLAIGMGYDAIVRDLNLKLKKNNCNFLQALILIALFFENSKDVYPSQLAKVFATSKGNISHSITHLEKFGFLSRLRNPNDARSYRISLKAAGKKLAVSLIKSIDQLENRFEKEVGKQQVLDVIQNIKLIKESYLRQPLI